MNKLHSFKTDISKVSLPKEIAYPYNYTPHTLAKIASKELQNYLNTQSDFQHDFGLTTNSNKGLGKMFGVLVVKNSKNTLGFIAAFSGRLADTNTHDYFVPPVFDILQPDSFYKQTENKINSINLQLEKLNRTFLNIEKEFFTIKEKYDSLFNEEQIKIKSRRIERKKENQTDNQKNINEEFYLREYKIYLDEKSKPFKKSYLALKKQRDDLKEQRKSLSNYVQYKIFESYNFLNYEGKSKNLIGIFNQDEIPAGAGDCCAPKLFQYAFVHQLTPVALAEFWWGKPLPSAIRKHKQFYPACSGKCKPILSHMLKGLPVEENPLLQQLSTTKTLDILYEDRYILAINKPPEFLTVKGKEIHNTIEQLVQKKYPDATGPMIVHRLDMSTSGILLITKTKEAHKKLQQQFIEKTIKKRYVAILSGKLRQEKGIINLPLCMDPNERPRQLVSKEYGKKAITHWEVITVQESTTKVYFYPITGRTHQLRVHAAHHLGLNTPIVGDDLYGEKADRLYLHADLIIFTHPINNKKHTLIAPAPF